MFRLKRCPRCKQPGWVKTVYSFVNPRGYANVCMECGWTSRYTRWEWQADWAWNRGKGDELKKEQPT